MLEIFKPHKSFKVWCIQCAKIYFLRTKICFHQNLLRQIFGYVTRDASLSLSLSLSDLAVMWL